MDGMGWISPGGPRYRAPYGANNTSIYGIIEGIDCEWQHSMRSSLVSDKFNWTSKRRLCDRVKVHFGDFFY